MEIKGTVTDIAEKGFILAASAFNSVQAKKNPEWVDISPEEYALLKLNERGESDYTENVAVSAYEIKDLYAAADKTKQDAVDAILKAP